MTLPGHVQREVEQALHDLRLGTRIRSWVAVGGGCISNGLRIDTRTGSFFLKWNASAPARMFEAEAAGLVALRDAEAVRAPEPLAWGGSADTPNWLLMEYIAPEPARPDSHARLGRGLAALHNLDCPGTFGFGQDNWIGALPQENSPGSLWGEFWRDRRIVPQLALARRRGYFDDTLLDRLVEVVPAALSDVATPQLLHGDLWSGNAFTASDGEPVIIDPAVYRGDGEVDLAMTELFGGFGRGFYDAYADAHGVSESYGPHRRDLYQLYYLLVHVNLFGASYVTGTRRAAERVLSEMV